MDFDIELGVQASMSRTFFCFSIPTRVSEDLFFFALFRFFSDFFSPLQISEDDFVLILVWTFSISFASKFVLADLSCLV